MESKEILIVPITDAIIPSGVVDQPSVCGTFNFITMKLISLSQGKFTQVDDWNYKWLNKWKWHVLKGIHTDYAVRLEWQDGKRNAILMHREIMQTPKRQETDHWDREGLNNQEYNLRPATNSQNQYNKVGWGKSKFKGVHFRRNKYEAYININKKRIDLGSYHNEELAARVYDNAAKYYFKEFANLNFK